MKIPATFVFLASILLTFLLTTPAFADPPVRKVTVNGTCIIKVVPDEMNWTVYVSIDDATLAKAKDRHDASLTAALAYIKSLGGSVKDLQTGGISFNKNNYAPENSAAALTPYSVATTLTFTLTDFDKYGPIADALSKIDGAQVQSVDYSSSKQDETTRQALKQALLNAHDKATDLATAADCYIEKPLEILEGSNGNSYLRPLLQVALAALVRIWNAHRHMGGPTCE
jgi:uncharacterized protein YggE